MPNGGYVKENGITLCRVCHWLAEEYHTHGKAPDGWHPDDLYKKIESSYNDAVNAAKGIK